MSKLNRSGIRRSGDDYQDLFAFEIVLDWLKHPDRYQWVRLEADDFAGSLDDVTALRSDGKFVVRQIKWTSNADEHRVSWDWVLYKDPSKPRQKSLLEKWSEAFFSLRQSHECEEAAIYTNRQIEDDFKFLLDDQRKIKAASLPEGIKEKIIEQVGSEEKLTEFFDAFCFFADHQSYSAKREALFIRFQELGGNQQGFDSLLESIRGWVKLKGHQILLDDVRKAARWTVLEGIHQGFQVPECYVLPDDEFHQAFRCRLFDDAEPLTVLTGVPGAGKSTYLSSLKKELEGEGFPVIRHHYYLSQDDTTGDRYSWPVVAQSLMSQIKEKYEGALGEFANKNAKPEDLRQWLESCGGAYRDQKQPFAVFIDGLDHVYRDRRSVEALLGIVDNLLPVPDNVVLVLGTRDVDDAHFPRRLLDVVPRADWVGLPFMNENAVREWVEFYGHQIGLPTDTRQREYRLNSVTAALFHKSKGYPLHLTYSLQALLEREQAVREENISALPICPGNDIRQYYDSLMRSLDESGQVMLHILCACGFKWPEGALSECLSGDKYGTVANIRKTESQLSHLLRLDNMGYSVYHISLEEYVCSLPDHQPVVKLAYASVIRWLEEAAPELWRWSYLWIIKHKNGDAQSLTYGPTEEWLKDALLRGYPLHQIIDILGRAAWAALDQNDIARTIQLNLMANYARSADDYQTNGLQRLLFCQLNENWSDPHLETRLLSDLDTLSDEELALYAENFSRSNAIEKVSVVKDFFEDKFFSDRNSGEYAYEHRRWNDVHYLDIIASLKSNNAESLLDWVREYDDGGDFIKHLQRLVSLKAVAALQNIAKSNLERKEALATTRALHDLAGRQSIKLSNWVLCENIKKAPLAKVRLFVEGVKSTSLDCYAPDAEVFSQSYRGFHGSQPALTDFYHDLFFSFLTLDLTASGEYEDIWLKKLDVHEWVMKACLQLADAARRASAKIRENEIPDALWLYSELTALDAPSDTFHSEEGRHCSYFQRALIEIAYDIQLLSNGAQVELAALQAIWSSRHFRKELWLDHLIDLRAEGFLSSDALCWLCEQEEASAREIVKPFNERYEDYMRLAQLCTLDGNSALSEKYARLAVQDALAVVYHKDSYLFELSDIVLCCAKKGLAEAKHWIAKLGSFVDQITECTDGDETDHVQLSFGEALLHIESNRFPDFYRRYLDEYEWCRSDDLLSRFRDQVDVEDPLNAAIIDTFDKKKRAGSSSSGTNHRSEEKIDYSAYPPSLLGDFFKELYRGDYIYKEELFKGWFDHWSNEPEQKALILQAMEAIAAKGIMSSYHTRIFYTLLFNLALDVAGKDVAYKILPKAHMESDGWSYMLGPREAAESTFQLIAKHWPEKWLDFIKDTASSSKVYSKEGGAPTIGLSRLVQYLLTLGKTDVIMKVGEMLVDFTLNRSGNMAFPSSPWVEADENLYGFIPLLFDRLDWPEVDAREETCQQIASLLQDSQYQNQIKEYYWLWLSKRVFESQCITAIILFRKCLIEDESIFDDEDLDRLIAGINAPSALSWILLSELKGQKWESGYEYSDMHSGDAPSDYGIPDFFTKYKTSLLPPIHEMRIDDLQRRGVLGLRQQWAYEVSCLYDRENIESRYPSAHYFINHYGQKRMSIFDLPQAEVFRSSYLRTLAWAYDNGQIGWDDMMLAAIAFCPVEFCSWQVKDGEAPSFWPRFDENETEDIDQTPAQVFQALEGVLTVEQDSDMFVGAAAGPVSVNLDGEGRIRSYYELSVYGLFQKVIGHDGEIDQEALIEEMRGVERIRAEKLSSNLAGSVPFVDIHTCILASGGSVFVPSVLEMRPMARWQNQQMYRGVGVVAPYISEDQKALIAKDDKLCVEHDGKVLSETAYWPFHGLNYWPSAFPPPLGASTMVSKEIVQQFCDSEKVSLCWLAELSWYRKTEEYGDDYEQCRFYRFYDLSHIIIDP